jgi:hypothetical protein
VRRHQRKPTSIGGTDRRTSIFRRVGGGQFLGDLGPCGPAPLSSRDFFLARQTFWLGSCDRVVPANSQLEKRLQSRTLMDLRKAMRRRARWPSLAIRLFIFNHTEVSLTRRCVEKSAKFGRGWLFKSSRRLRPIATKYSVRAHVGCWG